MQARWAGSAKQIKGRAAVAAGAFGVVAAVSLLVKAADPESSAAVWFGVVGVVGAVIAFVLAVLAARAESREEQQEFLRSLPGGALTSRVSDALADDAIYELGVEQEASQPLAELGLPEHGHAPYLPRRDADRALADRLTGAASRNGATLVVLRGPAKAGKTRTLLEALQHALPDAWLLRPAAGQLIALADNGPPKRCRHGPCVVWLNELESWVGYEHTELNAETIGRFSDWKQPVILLAAFKRSSPEGADRLKDPADDLLRRFPAMELAARLTGDDLDAARADPTFSVVAERLQSEGVGEFLIAAEQIRTVLTLPKPVERDAVAATNAVIDWRRCGLERPIPHEALAELYPLYRKGPPSDQRLQRGIEAACEPLIENIALVTHTTGCYTPYDYAVRVRDEQNEQVPLDTWRYVLNACASEPELLSVGSAAYRRDERLVAEDACRRADERGSADGASDLGVLLKERGDLAGAEAAYERADKRGSDDGASNLGALLLNRGDLVAAEAALRRADKRGSANGANNLGVLLKERGDLVAAEAAFKRADDRDSATGAYHLGVLLHERGDLASAEAAWRRADERGSAEGTYNLGVLLHVRGDLAAAEAAWRRADERGSAEGAHNLGVLLHERGDLAGAEAAWRRANERGSADGAVALGALLQERGNRAGAEDA